MQAGWHIRHLTSGKHARKRLDFLLALIFTAVLTVKYPLPSDLAPSHFLRAQAAAANPQSSERYEFRHVHDPNGTGRFYLGREIAQVMGFGGIDWLDRPDREQQEQPDVVIKAMDLHGGEVVADLGAGSGYFTFKLAKAVGKRGKVLAVDIQDEMLSTLRRRANASGVTNVETIKADETDPHLPAGHVAVVLMVDVYHELSHPYEVMAKVRDALAPGGRVVFVEYRKEDPLIPIKEVHKMSVEQLTLEMHAVGLERVKTVEKLPSQHIVIFKKSSDDAAKLIPKH